MRGLWGQTCKLSKSCTFHQLGAQVYASISPRYMYTCKHVLYTHIRVHTHRGNCNTEHAFRLPRLKSEKCVGFCGLLCFPPKLFIMFSSSFRLSFVWLFPLLIRLFLVVALHAVIPISLARALKLRCPIGNLLQIHLNQ